MKKIVNYEKEFLSRKGKLIEDICAKEHNEFTKEFKEKFANDKQIGSDGLFIYSYEIKSTIIIPDYINKELPYKLIFTINKFGNENKFHHSCDLEYFLRDRGFNKVD